MLFIIAFKKQIQSKWSAQMLKQNSNKARLLFDLFASWTSSIVIVNHMISLTCDDDWSTYASDFTAGAVKRNPRP